MKDGRSVNFMDRMLRAKRKIMADLTIHVRTHCISQRYMSAQLSVCHTSLDSQLNGRASNDPAWLTDLFTTWLLPGQLNRVDFEYLINKRWGSVRKFCEAHQEFNYYVVYRTVTRASAVWQKPRTIELFDLVGYYRGPSEAEQIEWLELMGRWRAWLSRMIELIIIEAPGMKFYRPDELRTHYEQMRDRLDQKIEKVKKFEY